MSLIFKKSFFTGKMNSRSVDVTLDEIDEWKRSGKCIQDALPNLTKEDREFLLTGATPEEWNALFGPEEKEDNSKWLN